MHSSAATGFDPAVKLCVNGRDVLPDYAVLALPFDVLRRVLPEIAPARPLCESLEKFESSPITGVHLWFDRRITNLDHAVLLDRTIQWMFHKSQIQVARNSKLETGNSDSGSYVELVISASKSLVSMSRSEIVELAIRELAEFFPAVGEAQLLKATVIKEVHATFSPLPGSDTYRPRSDSPWPQVFLAGDWTATGWPATMEGAVRSGYLAAEAVCRAAGLSRRFLAPDLPPAGLMRLFR
jgi:zeta-carotene desaturase